MARMFLPLLAGPTAGVPGPGIEVGRLSLLLAAGGPPAGGVAGDLLLRPAAGAVGAGWSWTAAAASTPRPLPLPLPLCLPDALLLPAIFRCCCLQRRPWAGQGEGSTQTYHVTQDLPVEARRPVQLAETALA